MKYKKLLRLSRKLASMNLHDSAEKVRLLDDTVSVRDEGGSSSDLLREDETYPLNLDKSNKVDTKLDDKKMTTGAVLKRGDKGDEVKALQQKLAEKGYAVSYSGSGGIDGDYGKNTENAVIYFQVLNDIDPPTGIADSAVMNKVNSGNFIGPNDTKEPHPEAEKLEYTEKDVDAISRCVFVETGFRSNYREIAGIIWVVINRSKRWDMPLWKVVDPKTGGGKNWYGKLSSSNKIRWKEAHKRHPNFDYIKGFVRKILDGVSFKNEIGNKAHFLHPGGMPRCTESPGSPSASGKSRCVHTGTWGKRWLPKWNIDGNTNMAGKVEVKTIGRARFS
tara:strand:- start:1624 stop:2622 length:999 start_codon:yes stop_codon:yes gene_type:complete